MATNMCMMDSTDSRDNSTFLSKQTSAVSRWTGDGSVQVTQALVSSSKNIVSQTLRHGIIENFITIWLDPTMNESSDDYQSWIAQLRRTVNSFKTLNNHEECIDFIQNVKDQKVFLILSGAFNETLISRIHDLPQLDSIYIFCIKMVNHEPSLKERRKIKGIFSDISLICNQIKQNARQCEHDLTPMTIVSASYALDLNELDPSFMYSQLLKEILLGMEYDEDAKREFVSFLEIQYADNDVTLNSIAKFGHDYDIYSPAWWYTKESFIYSVLNRALQTQDIDIIIKMGFFIRDLHQQIERIHLQTHQGTNTIVYRGQGMTNAEFEKIKHNENGLLAFNNFLSTSTDQQVASAFADSAQMNPDLTGILFQMEIDSSISSACFASLHDISYYSDSEQEILFSMHTIFRIGSMQQIDDRLWQVNLKLTSDNDEQLERVTDYLRKEIGGGTQRHLLGKLMIKMGKLNKAEEVFKALIESTSDNNLREIADLKCHLGHVKLLQGDTTNALLYYEKTLEIREKILPSTDPDLARTYSSIGSVYASMGNYSIALSYYEKALEIREKTLPYTDPDLAKTYNNMGAVNYQMGNYSTALSYYEKTLEIKQKSLPPTHPDLATTYNNVAAVQKSMGDYSTALSSYEKALKIEEKSLPSTHFNLATTYNNIAVLRMSMKDYSTALSDLEKTLEIQQKSLSPIHPDLALTYINIGGVHMSMKTYSTALLHFKTALNIQEKSLSPIHPSLAKTYSNIGRAHDLMEDYSTALSYYEMTLEIQQKSLQSSHPDLAITYNKMANLLNSLKRYKEAFIHAERAVDIAFQTVGSNHPNFQMFQNDMEQIRQKL